MKSAEEDTMFYKKEYYKTQDKESLLKTIWSMYTIQKNLQRLLAEERAENDYLKRKLSFHGFDIPDIEKIGKTIKKKYSKETEEGP